MSLAYKCPWCNAEPNWRIDRTGDAVVSWACDQHLAAECRDLQRAHETTSLMVRVAAELSASRVIQQAFGKVEEG